MTDKNTDEKTSETVVFGRFTGGGFEGVKATLEFWLEGNRVGADRLELLFDDSWRIYRFSDDVRPVQEHGSGLPYSVALAIRGCYKDAPVDMKQVEEAFKAAVARSGVLGKRK